MFRTRIEEYVKAAGGKVWKVDPVFRPNVTETKTKTADEDNSDKEDEELDGSWICKPIAALKKHFPNGLEEQPDDSDSIRKAKGQLKTLEEWWGSNRKSQTHLCDVCGHSFPSVSDTITHICRRHFDMARVLTCADCGKVFLDEKTLDRHLNRFHLKVEPYICPVKGCEHKTSSIAGFRAHIYNYQVRRSKLPPKSDKVRKSCEAKYDHPKFSLEEKQKLMEGTRRLFR